MTATTPEAPDEAPAASAPRLLAAPADGVPPIVDTPAALAEAVAALAAGHGPLAVDTERAQSFRYSAKAYLIQLRRAGAGTVLVDPVAFEGDADRADLSGPAEALAHVEWVIHAAQQDLPCLAEVKLLPRRLFDTELAGRLLGFPRVSLTSLTERALGTTLAKEHSAADWSKRPLPTEWLSYAALDVELLADLREWVAAELERAGKEEWARQEFDFLVRHAADPPSRRDEPWRRTSGVHELRYRGQLAVVRALWEARDEIARRIDRAPGRVLPDAAIIELAARVPRGGSITLTRDDLREVRGFGWRLAARFEREFVEALQQAAALDRADWPAASVTPEGPPPPRTWGRRFPEAFARWNRLRPATLHLAETLQLPVENLIAPDALRRLAWEPPADPSPESVDAFLAERLARPWQRAHVVPVVSPLLG
nr:ribonuclease D [Propionibacterium sp.]